MFDLPEPSQSGQYKCIVVDPPWDQGMIGKRSARPKSKTEFAYPLMAPGEIAELPVREWASPQSFLWLWATNSRSGATKRPILIHAFELMEHWGFRYYAMLTWCKAAGPTPFGPYQMATEQCLFGFMGKADFKGIPMGKFKTHFLTPQPKVHSEKPEVLYQHIANSFPGPRLDVFSRRRHHGFDSWGNEAQSEIQEMLL